MAFPISIDTMASRCATLLILLAGLCGQTAQAQDTPSNLFYKKLQLLQNGSDTIELEPIYYADTMQAIYARRSYVLIWTVDAQIPQQTLDFWQCIAQTEDNGLMPTDYHYNPIGQLLNSAIALSQNDLLNLDILLTDAYLLIAKHYKLGKVNPDKANVAWHLSKRFFNPTNHLEQTLLKGTNLCESLNELLPKYQGYKDLRAALKQYRNMGAWSEPIKNSYSLLLQYGSADAVVSEVKRRLQITGDYPATASSDAFFNKELEKAVMQFQQRHGLHYDGLVRYVTVQALNISPTERLKQIKANLERWRWMPENTGNTCILVNIPGFQLEMMQDGQIVYTEDIVVGRETFPTPSFSDSITHIIFNPYWYIPKSIASAELKPLVLLEPEYFVNNDMRVSKGGKQIDPRVVDWNKANWDDYTFSQGPSVSNPMGVVKFMFPNKHDIYIHDTPARDLFDNSRRTYSHGCVRVKDPVKFATFLLQNNQGWDSTYIKNVLFSQKETKVNLNKQVPIHLLYWTAFTDSETGILNFREDIYKWDAALYAALSKPIQPEEKVAKKATNKPDTGKNKNTPTSTPFITSSKANKTPAQTDVNKKTAPKNSTENKKNSTELLKKNKNINKPAENTQTTPPTNDKAPQTPKEVNNPKNQPKKTPPIAKPSKTTNTDTLPPPPAKPKIVPRPGMSAEEMEEYIKQEWPEQ